MYVSFEITHPAEHASPDSYINARCSRRFCCSLAWNELCTKLSLECKMPQ